MNWQRARTDEKKNERKEAIYDAALALFKEKGYEKVSFNKIASEAGFTKSNMYRYFSSKEEIFLNIFASLFEAWFEDISQRLKKLNQDVEVELFAENWVASNMSHPQFLDLTPILFLSLESNSSYEQLLEFKQLSMNLLYQLAIEIARVYPNIQGEKAFQFLTLSFAATANYWAAESHQNEALNKIYQLEPFKELKPNFEKSLKASVEVIIKGLQAV
ncbi:TetR family transcriptional regulator [Thalassomonas actiniarum]|uniref:TetR family transcriptional regulator n=1 Tax=Thalassomonas actiniarum TaxID=485447 RepID=A0AAF0C6T7_9GAMM|nr:TetR family transcriptional regulator [Thalassomonas actiniarum]WDE02460.1 TetR family transcriptional regulator [Thalassomonas actiniarum]